MYVYLIACFVWYDYEVSVCEVECVCVCEGVCV